MFWDIYQQGRIGANSSDLRILHDHSHNTRTWTKEDILRMADRLVLACQAMWEILRDEGGVNEEKLLAKIQEIIFIAKPTWPQAKMTRTRFMCNT